MSAGGGDGALSGLSVAVKDVIDVAGVATGAGNPAFLEAASPAVAHAEAVSSLLSAGAVVVGKAHTDEFAYSLSGTNVHYGTPINAAAPGRVPGGSSCGPASAVCSGLADIGLRNGHGRLCSGAGVVLRGLGVTSHSRARAGHGHAAAGPEL